MEGIARTDARRSARLKASLARVGCSGEVLGSPTGFAGRRLDDRSVDVAGEVSA